MNPPMNLDQPPREIVVALQNTGRPPALSLSVWKATAYGSGEISEPFGRRKIGGTTGVPSE